MKVSLLEVNLGGFYV